MKNNYIKFPLILSLFGIIATLLLAVVYQVTAPIIERNNNAAEYAALDVMVPGADFVTSTVAFSDEAIVKIYEAREDGTLAAYVYKTQGSGYGGNTIQFLVAISVDGDFIGFKATDLTGQTDGIGSRIGDAEFSDPFVGEPITTTINGIAGATFTSNGAKSAIAAAVAHFRANFE